MIYENNEHDYRRIGITYSEEEMVNMDATLGRFNNSMNFVFGLADLPHDFDILNNPYIEVIGYELYSEINFNNDMRVRDKYDFELCTDEQKAFMPQHAQDWYS